MTEQDDLRVILLDDSPSDTDSFGAHSRVAQAIAELIKSDTRGGKVVGLQGGWGSGKTTVTRLLAARLPEGANHGLITFDTWAHEGDPLRRTFLECSVEGLLKLGWVSESKWSKRLDEIACRRKETTKKTIPKPTALGTWFALSVLSVPFGSALLGDALRDGAEYTLDPSRPFSVQLLVGTLLTLSWGIVLIGNLVRIGLAKARGERVEDPWNFLFSKSTTEETTSTVEMPEPTSVEFDRYFTDLLKEALESKPERRLTVILDNLDRVDADHGLALWATLQTFLQDRSQITSGWFRQLWILVPYDPSGLSRIWDRSETVSDRASVSFMDKVFAVRFRVPQLLLANWRDYLLEQAQQAFPQLSRSELRPLLSVFEIYVAQDQSPPATPRSIKVYLNQAGSLLRQWGRAFPLAHVGYYAIVSHNQPDLAASLRDGSIPEPDYEHALGASSTQNLAGLHFNVDPQTGQQLLLNEVVHAALSKPDAASLAELAEVHGNGLYSVVGHVVAVQIAREGGRANCTAARSIHDAELDGEHPELVAAINQIVASIRDEESWSLLDSDCSRGLQASLSLMDSPARSKRLVTNVAANLPKTAADIEGEKGLPSAHVSAWLGVLKAAKELGHEEASRVAIVVPCDGEGWTAACGVLSDEDPTNEYSHAFSPSLSSTQVSEYYQKIVQDGNFEDRDADAVQISSRLPSAPNWEGLLVAVRDRLHAPVGADVDEARALLNVLVRLRRLGVKENAKQATTFDRSGHVLHHLHAAVAAEDERMQALCLLLFITANPAAGAPAQAGNSQAGHTALTKALAKADSPLLDELGELTVSYSSLDHLIAVQKARGNWDPLLKSLLQRLAKHPRAVDFFEPEALVSNWWALRKILDEDGSITPLVREVDKDRSLSAYVEGLRFAGEAVSVAYNVLLAGGADADFVKWCREGLEGLDDASWVEALQAKQWSALVLIELDKLDEEVRLQSKYVDAHVELAEQILSGEIDGLPFLEHWPVLLKPLGNQGLRKGLRTKLLDAALSKDGQFPDLFLSAYGAELAEHQGLASEDAVIRLFAPLVKSGRPAGLEWFKAVLTARPEVATICGDSSASELLHSRVRDALAEDDSEDPDPSALRQIASALGIDSEEIGDADSEGEADEAPVK